MRSASDPRGRGRRVVRLAVRVAVITIGALAAVVALLITMNPAPAAPTVEMAQTDAERAPIVIKLHARWCPVCMVTKDVWRDIGRVYAGKVRLAVFDFTTDATTEASRKDAQRLGVDAVFDEYVGETGTVVVVDGSSKEVRHSIHGVREFAEYQTAIDDALRSGR